MEGEADSLVIFHVVARLTRGELQSEEKNISIPWKVPWMKTRTPP